MTYNKQTWTNYDDNKSEQQNKDAGAVITPQRLNHMEMGIANSTTKQEFDQNKNEVTSQLAQKVDEVIFDVSSQTIKFYANGLLVRSVNITEASNASLVQSYIDSLVVDGLIEGVTIADGAVTKDTLSGDIKNMLDTKIESLIKNGDFNNGATDWVFGGANSSVLDGQLSLVGDGTSPFPRAQQRLTGGYLGGHKIYVRGNFRIADKDTNKNVGFKLLSSNWSGPSEVFITAPYVPKDKDIVVSGIGTLTSGHNGTDLVVQVGTHHHQASDALGQRTLIDNLVVINLTSCFGAGNEPTAKEMDKILSIFTKKHFNGTVDVGDLSRVGVYDTEIQENKKIKKLPYNLDRFTANDYLLFDYDKHDIYSRTSAYTSFDVLADGKPTFEIKSTGSNAQIKSNLIYDVDFYNFNYIDIYFSVENSEEMANVGLNFSAKGDTSNVFYSKNIANAQIKKVNQDGERFVRLSKEDFIADGTPSWSNIGEFTFVLRGGSSASPTTINVSKIEVVLNKKAGIYMYFDDATIGHYDYAFPILEKYGLIGTVAVPTERVGQNIGTGGQRCTWAQLREMYQAGWNIVSHGLDEKSLATLTPAEIEHQLKKSSQDLLNRGFVFGSKGIVAPQGSWSIEVDTIAKKYFAMARTFNYNAGRYTGARSQEYPQMHPRAQYYFSPHNYTVEQIKGYIDNAIANKHEISLAWHIIEPEPYTIMPEYSDTPERLEEVCAHIRQRIDEGVLECVTWRDTMLQSTNVDSIDLEGNQYLVSVDDKVKLLELPIEA